MRWRRPIPRPRLARKALRRLLAALLIPPLAGCGYLIFPERAGQPQGRLDWGVVGLDAVGLLFGIVPGVIAFAVDFATGCVYLPSPPYAGLDAAAPVPGLPAGWRQVATFDPDRPGALGDALAAQLGPTFEADMLATVQWQRTPGPALR